MNKRIRYVKDENGGLKSMRAIRSEDGTDYIAIIDASGVTGRIKTAKLSGFSVEVAGPSPHKVKIKIKTALQLLRCAFELEKRVPRKKGEENEN